MAGLRKLRNKYYIRVWVDGKEKLLPTGTSIKTDAEKQFRKIQHEEIEIKQRLRKELSDLHSRLTIQDGINYFLNNVGKERNLQKTTLYTYSLAMKDFRNCFKHLITFDRLSKKHYSNLLDYLQNRYNSTTVNIRLRSIRAMLNYLLEKEMIKMIPFKVKQIKTDKTLPKFILPEEMDSIYSNVNDDRLLSIFRVYEMTGLRVGELVNSHRDGEFITVEQSKGRKERIIPIPLDNVSDYDLAKELSYSVSWVSHSFSKACWKAGLKDKTIHCLRHTFALRKLIETNNISLVKELLGHSSVTVTETYTQFPRDFLVQVFKDKHINQNHNQQKATA